MTTEVIPPIEINIGERCTHCGDNTSAGSGKFVNRIPSDSEWEIETSSGECFTVNVDGWMCAECAAWDCDECGEKIPLDEDVYIEHPILYALHVHEECVHDAWKEFIE